MDVENTLERRILKADNLTFVFGKGPQRLKGRTADVLAEVGRTLGAAGGDPLSSLLEGGSISGPVRSVSSGSILVGS